VIDAFIALEQDFIDIAKRFSDADTEATETPAGSVVQ
jgi:hypothetical protein